MDQTTIIRLSCFSLALALLSLWEYRQPRRPRTEPRRQRWPTNLSLTLLNTMMLRFSLAPVPYLLTEFSASSDIGLLHQLNLASWLQVVLTWVILEAVIYWQHRLFHRQPLLWRLHQVHHSDRDLDWSSGMRFHPIEMILSLIVKSVAVIVLGADPLGYLIFELSLNLGAMFSHSNIYLSPRLDRWLRSVIVTPDMHRIHHSVKPGEHHRNFAFTLSFFDRVFGSYKSLDFHDQKAIIIGLASYSKAKLGLWQLIKLPFSQPKNLE